VGEAGAELVRFNGGERVLSHAQSMATGLKVPGFASGTGPVGAAQARTGVANPTGGPALGSVISAIGHGVVSLTGAGLSVLRTLVGDALGVGINTVLNPLLNAIPGTGTAIGQYIKGDVVKVAGDLVNFIKGKSAAQAAAAAVAAPVAGAFGGVVQTAMKLAAAARGWTGAQWNALNAVEMAEAGYNLNAKNPSSGAYGLAQFINGPSEYAQYGGNATTVGGQITAMLNYIAQRYGTPAAAWAHEQAFHWYDNGGMIPEPVWGVGASGKKYGFRAGENVQSADAAAAQTRQLSAVVDRLDRLIAVSRSAPNATGRSVGGVINGATADAAWRQQYPKR
jgi:hypothetical protein